MSPFRSQIRSRKYFGVIVLFSLLVLPLVFVGQAGAADVSLAWDESGEPGLEVDGYRVYYGTDGQSFPHRGCEVVGTSCTVSGLTPGQTYYFVATAFNAGGESAYSVPPINYTPSVPGVPAYTITASSGPNGKIFPAGAAVVNGGGSLTFTIIPDSGYQIAEVLVDGGSIGTASTYTFNNVFENYTITAVFEPVSSPLPAPNVTPDVPEHLLPEDNAVDLAMTPLLEIVGFTDPNQGDSHGATRWQVASDPEFSHLVLDIMSDTAATNNYLLSLLVPQGALAANRTYFWRAMVKDARADDSKWSDWSASSRFTTAADAHADVNYNGVPDESEPLYSDLDNNGQNDNEQPLMRVVSSPDGQSLIGINGVEGVSRINCFTSADAESIPDEPRPKLKYGLMVFSVVLKHPGDTAKIELLLPELPRLGAKWYKYDPVNGWYEFPVSIENDAYVVEITDGGFGDADGVANGIVVDPIGMADSAAVTEPSGIDSSGSDNTIDELLGACFVETARTRTAVIPSVLMTWMGVARFLLGGILIFGTALVLVRQSG